MHAGQTWLEERSTIGMQIQVASSVLVRQHREEEEEGMRRWANRGEGGGHQDMTLLGEGSYDFNLRLLLSILSIFRCDSGS